MSILTTSEVADFLGLPSTADGLQSAIEQAEALVAAEMRLDTLEFKTYADESKLLTYTTQQVLPEHGPVQQLTAFEYDDEDYLSEVGVDPSGWSIRWNEARPVRDFDRVKSFERLKNVKYSYSAGWTDSEGAYPLPKLVVEYVKMMTGLVYQNALASGVSDVKLGDFSMRFDRSTLESRVGYYMPMISKHARPY